MTLAARRFLATTDQAPAEAERDLLGVGLSAASAQAATRPPRDRREATARAGVRRKTKGPGR